MRARAFGCEAAGLEAGVAGGDFSLDVRHAPQDIHITLSEMIKMCQGGEWVTARESVAGRFMKAARTILADTSDLDRRGDLHRHRGRWL